MIANISFLIDVMLIAFFQSVSVESQAAGGRQGGFTAGAVVVLMALVRVLMLAEWRGRDGYHKHRSVGTHPCVGHAPMFFSGPVRLRCR